MEMAKVTSKGQITIPVSIRKRLGINEGDKLLFIDSPNGVIMVNPDTLSTGQEPDIHPVSEKPVMLPETTSRTGTAQRSDSISYTKSTPAARGSDHTGKAETRPKGLDVGALLDEIRSIGSKI